ncbi:pirin [Brachybacterium endophyticum]|uniref:Pirin n=1 Tax=Brachybacterium endophyticum TaxID=2182385 RepID=A0A2U2RMU3_9MICO|nr:pirin family protein [Brachybacterium endophyticum]PWH07166.1 pirin [Brachybacterium endophyticum]
MSTTEKNPQEVRCAAAEHVGPTVITPREVPLGGPRAMTVRRTLPHRERSLIGPWCFVDHFGPDDVAASGGMAVPRHPHTGLATVTLLFEGRIEHRDSTDFANTVRPGEVNLMIAGRGVSHSEFSTADTRTLHGVQLWYALPESERHGDPGSQHHVAPLVEVPGGAVRTYLGELAEATAAGDAADAVATGTAPSPIDTRTTALAAEVLLPTAGRLLLPVDPTFEHGVLVDAGTVHVATRTETTGDGAPREDEPVDLQPDDLVHLPVGASHLVLEAGAEPARLILIGGPPFEEEIVMWWNFVGRSHEEIAAFREQWQHEIAADDAPSGPPAFPATVPPRSDRFGPFPSDTPAPLPAPALPHARLRPRRQPRGSRS